MLFSIRLEELRLELLFLGIILDSIDSSDFRILLVFQSL